MAVGEARAPWYRPGRRASWRRAAGRLRGGCLARFPSLRRRTPRALAAPRPCGPLGSAPEPTSARSHPLGAARRRPAPETRRRAVPSRRSGGSSSVGCLGARGLIQLRLASSRASPARDARRRIRVVRFPAFPAGGFFPEAIHRKAPMRARTERRRRTRAARPRARRDTCGRDLRDVRFLARVCARRRPVNRKAEPNLPHLEARHLCHTDRCVQMTRRCRVAEANSIR